MLIEKGAPSQLLFGVNKFVNPTPVAVFGPYCGTHSEKMDSAIKTYDPVYNHNGVSK